MSDETQEPVDVNYEHDRLASYFRYLQEFQPTWDLLREKVTRKRNDVVSHFKRRKSEEDMFAQGNCFQQGPEVKEKFFSSKPSEQNQAKKICTGCPIKGACLNFALEHPEGLHAGSGVWGGTTEGERQVYRAPIARGLLHPLDTPELKSTEKRGIFGQGTEQ
jgi:WhiB family redox-sensing transcriptional regulator